MTSVSVCYSPQPQKVVDTITPHGQDPNKREGGSSSQRDQGVQESKEEQDTKNREDVVVEGTCLTVRLAVCLVKETRGMQEGEEEEDTNNREEAKDSRIAEHLAKDTRRAHNKEEREEDCLASCLAKETRGAEDYSCVSIRRDCMGAGGNGGRGGNNRKEKEENTILAACLAKITRGAQEKEEEKK